MSYWVERPDTLVLARFWDRIPQSRQCDRPRVNQGHDVAEAAAPTTSTCSYCCRRWLSMFVIFWSTISLVFQCPWGHAISAVQPGPAAMVKRKPCNLTIAATKLRPRPRPLVFRLLSER
jgi:hypothetical protein